VTVTYGALLEAIGYGGNAYDDGPNIVTTGGAGTGGNATINVNGGSVEIENHISLDASGFGGRGINGGAGTGGGVDPMMDPMGLNPGAGIFAANGSVTFSNPGTCDCSGPYYPVYIQSNGIGGQGGTVNDGTPGYGGVGTGGKARDDASTIDDRPGR